MPSLQQEANKRFVELLDNPQRVHDVEGAYYPDSTKGGSSSTYTTTSSSSSSSSSKNNNSNNNPGSAAVTKVSASDGNMLTPPLQGKDSKGGGQASIPAGAGAAAAAAADAPEALGGAARMGAVESRGPGQGLSKGGKPQQRLQERPQQYRGLAKGRQHGAREPHSSMPGSKVGVVAAAGVQSQQGSMQQPQSQSQPQRQLLTRRLLRHGLRQRGA